MEFKQMIYYSHRNVEILADDNFDGYHFVIVSQGVFPCAYVEVPKEHPLYLKNYNDCPISAHGCLTYGDDLIHLNPEYKGYYIGWDYGHIGDFIGYASIKNEHKYTTEEIFEDVKDVIHQLKALENENKDN